MYFLILLLLGCSAVSAQPTKDRPDDSTSSITSVNTESRHQGQHTAINPEKKRKDDPSERVLVAAVATTGFKLLTKANDIVGQAKDFFERIGFLMGIGSSSPEPASKEDIKNLKDQLTNMEAFIASSFAQVLSSVEFGQVVLNYNRFVHNLQSIVLLDVLKHIEDKNTMSKKTSKKVATELVGGKSADSTEFALIKVHEMLTGTGITTMKSLYRVLAEKHAACVPNCPANYNDVLEVATNYNVLQAASYGALEAALMEKDKTDAANALKDTMKKRMVDQVNALSLAQERFLSLAGSGSKFAKLESPLGGCLAYSLDVPGKNFHLRDCNDEKVYTFRLEKNKAKQMHILLYGGYANHCVGVDWKTKKDDDCYQYSWFFQVNKVDPQYIRLKAGGKCVVTDTEEQIDGKNRKLVKMAYCKDITDEQIKVEQRNPFWKFTA